MKKYKHGGMSISIIRQYFPKVETVKDATKAIRIEVTNHDNKSAAVRDHHACALAVACKRTMKADGVIIGTTTAYVIFGKSAQRFKLTETTSREIVSFDRNGGFDPGVYRLRPPSDWEKLGHLGKPMGTKTVTGKTRKLRHYTGKIRTALGTGITA